MMHTFANTALGALVLLPLLGAAISVLIGHRARRILAIIIAGLLVLLLVPVVSTVSSGAMPEIALGGYEAPLGIHLRADGLSVAFLMLTMLVGTAVTIYAAVLPSSTGMQLTAGYPNTAAWKASHPGFWPLWLGCWAGLNAVFVSGDLFNTYVGIELVGLTAIGLVALGGPQSWRAALRYLFIAVIGSLLFLVGVALIVSVTGTLDIQQSAVIIRELLTDGGADNGTEVSVSFAVILITLGMAMKVALVPMHRWLIPAHSNAPSAVSPLMSALVIKAALFVLLRVWLELLGEPTELLTGFGWLLGMLGALALILGSILALRQSRLKPLIAYSTVAQVGYWFLLFPVLVAPDTGNIIDRPAADLSTDQVLSGAVAATVILALGHGLAKASLFLAAGFLKDVYGTDDITRLRGAGRHHPMLIMSVGFSAIGLVGLPVSLSFTGKWQLATTAVAAGHYWILAVLVAGTLLSAAYMLKILAPLLVESDDDIPDHAATHEAARHYPAIAPAIPFVLGILVIVTGFAGVWINNLLTVGGVS